MNTKSKIVLAVLETVTFAVIAVTSAYAKQCDVMDGHCEPGFVGNKVTAAQGTNRQDAPAKPAELLPVTTSVPVGPTTETVIVPVVIDNGGEVLPEPTPEETPEVCSNGNPGNLRCNGNAGENPNGRGTMDNDATHGNGQHGNQGEGGNR